ncbi:MAG: phenylalanine--tRNA ligase subunit beta [archaeon]
MTILTLNKKEFENSIGKIDNKLRNKIDMFGTPIDNETDDEISIEVFPNRPDLLSMQGFVRAINNFLGKSKINEYKVEKSGEKLIIEKNIPKQWPYAFACIVKGLKFDDDKIKEVIDIQEKIGASYHRKRKKGGIGVYPLEKIKFPIRFKGLKPEDIKFRPLEFPRVINGRQILSQHPTGREYGHLCEGWDVFPIFIDKDDVIMSMPPIINSHEVGKIDTSTKNLFVEATGNDYNALRLGMNMIVTALADMGGKIYSIDCEYEGGKKEVVPDLEPEKMEFSVDKLNKTLGLELSEKEIKDLLGKMGIGVEIASLASKDAKGGNRCIALVPAYRTDILHEIDLSEEVAIAYGYDNFKPEIPEISTIGCEDDMSILKRRISEVLVGLSLLEVSSFHISTKEKQFKNIGIKEFKDNMIEVEDSKTENNILRESLFANSINILSENSDASYPQKIFELGKVFSDDRKYQDSETGIKEEERLCVSLCGEKSDFTEIKQALDYLMRMLDIKYKIEETEKPGFIDGRCGKIIVDSKEIGVLGEVSPFILKNSKIKMPLALLEISIEEFN